MLFIVKISFILYMYCYFVLKKRDIAEFFI